MIFIRSLNNLGNQNVVFANFPPFTIAGVIQSRSRLRNRFACEYAGTVKRHNACKRHGFLDTGFTQTQRAVFSTLCRWDKNETAFKCLFEETVPKSSVNFVNRTAHKILENKFAAEMPYLYHR